MTDSPALETLVASPGTVPPIFPAFLVDSELPLPELTNALDRALSSGANEVFFANGELFARADIKHVVSALRDRRITFAVRTDGRFLARPEILSKLKAAGLRHVRVVFPAGSPYASFLATGHDVFFPLLGRIQVATRAGLHVQLAVPVTMTNRGTLRLVVRIAESVPGRPPVLFEEENDLLFHKQVLDAAKYRRQLHGIGPELLPARWSYRSTGETVRLDLRICPWRRASTRPKDPGSHLLVEQEEGLYEFYAADREIPPLEAVFIRCVQESVFMKAPEGMVRLRLAPACRSCQSLVQCHPCYVAQAPQPPTEIRFNEELPGLGDAPSVEVTLDNPVANLPLLRQAMEALDVGPRLVITGRLPVILLDGEAQEDAVLPPTSLGLLADMAAACLLRPVGHRLPEDDSGRFQLVYERCPQGELPYTDRLAVLTISSACVADCIMCSLPRSYGGQNLDSPSVFACLQQTKLLGFTAVNFVGGTIDMRPDHRLIIEAAKSLNFYTLLISTGFRLDEEHIDGLCEAGLDLLELGLDGHNAVLHDSIRRRDGMFDRAVQASDLAQASQRIHVGINTIILRDNIKLLPEIHRFVAGRLGATRHRMFFFVQIPSELTDPRWPTYEQSLEFLSSMYAELLELSRELGSTIDFCPPVSPEDLKKPETFAIRVSQGNYSPGRPCKVAGRDLMVMPDGTLYACASPLILRGRTPLGNVQRDRIRDCLDNAAMREWRESAGTWSACRLCPQADR